MQRVQEKQPVLSGSRNQCIQLFSNEFSSTQNANLRNLYAIFLELFTRDGDRYKWRHNHYTVLYRHIINVIRTNQSAWLNAVPFGVPAVVPALDIDASGRMEL